MCNQSLAPRGVSVSIEQSSHEIDCFAQRLGGGTYQIFPRNNGFIKYFTFPSAERAAQFLKGVAEFPNALSANAINCP